MGEALRAPVGEETEARDGRRGSGGQRPGGQGQSKVSVRVPWEGEREGPREGVNGGCGRGADEASTEMA